LPEPAATARAERVERLGTASICASALALHAAAQGRLLLALPPALVLAFGLWRRTRIAHDRFAMSLTMAAGALFGFAVNFVQEPREGPLPPVVLGPLSGLLAALCCFCFLSRRAEWARTYAWLLASLSVFVPLSVSASAGMVAVVTAALVTALAELTLAPQRRPDESSAKVRAGFAAYVVCMALFAVATIYGVLASEGWLMRQLSSLTPGAHLPHGFGLEGSLYLGPRNGAALSERALFEVDASAPDHLRAVVLDELDAFGASTSAAMAKAVRPPPPEVASSLTLHFLADTGGVIPVPAGARTAGPRELEASFTGGYVLRGHSDETEAELGIAADDTLPPEPAPGPSLLELPPKLRPIAALALPFASGGEPLRAARAIEASFQRDYTYSLEVDLRDPKEPPLLVLVRDRRPAYCSYFAAAMVAMLRSLGIPARVIGGFLVSERNPITGRAVVRERDAHAWVEAWLPAAPGAAARWLAFDPTPRQARDAAVGAGPPGRVAMVLGALASGLRRFFAHPLRSLGALLRSKAALSLAVLGAGFFIVRRLRGRRGRKRGPSLPREKALLRARERWQEITLLAGAPQTLAETDDELVARLPGTAQAAARGFLSCYREARWGAGPIDEALLRQGLDALEAALRRAGREAGAKAQ
jgi:protein-glutamine gamma-glutamyltransferase